jgi:hypothetical protein
MLQARQVVECRLWNTALESVDENWWMDVLADPRGRVRKKPIGYNRYGKSASQHGFYTLADEIRPRILIACTKCPWMADFNRTELVTTYGLDFPLPNLLEQLAAPDCSRRGNQWDRCGAYYGASTRIMLTQRLAYKGTAIRGKAFDVCRAVSNGAVHARGSKLVDPTKHKSRR